MRNLVKYTKLTLRPIDVSPTKCLKHTFRNVQEGKNLSSYSLRCMLVYFKVKLRREKKSINTPFLQKTNYFHTSKSKKNFRRNFFVCMYSHHKKAEIIAKQSEMKSHLDDFCKGYVARNRTHENSAIIS